MCQVAAARCILAAFKIFRVFIHIIYSALEGICEFVDTAANVYLSNIDSGVNFPGTRSGQGEVESNSKQLTSSVPATRRKINVGQLRGRRNKRKKIPKNSKSTEDKRSARKTSTICSTKNVCVCHSSKTLTYKSKKPRKIIISYEFPGDSNDSSSPSGSTEEVWNHSRASESEELRTMFGSSIVPGASIQNTTVNEKGSKLPSEACVYDNVIDCSENSDKKSEHVTSVQKLQKTHFGLLPSDISKSGDKESSSILLLVKDSSRQLKNVTGCDEVSKVPEQPKISEIDESMNIVPSKDTLNVTDELNPKNVSLEISCGIGIKTDESREEHASKHVVHSLNVKDVSKETIETCHQKDTSNDARNRKASQEDSLPEITENLVTQMDHTIHIPDTIERKNDRTDMTQDLKAHETSPLNCSSKQNIPDTTIESLVRVPDRNSPEQVSNESLIRNDSMSETIEKVLNERRNIIETQCKVDQKGTSKTIPLDTLIEKEDSRKVSPKPNLEEDMNESVDEIPSVKDGSVQSSVTSFQKDTSSEMLELEMTENDIVKETVNIMDQKDASEGSNQDFQSIKFFSEETKRETVIRHSSRESPRGITAPLVGGLNDTEKSVHGSGDNRKSDYAGNKMEAENKDKVSITSPSKSNELDRTLDYIQTSEDVDDDHIEDKGDVRSNSSTILRLEREAVRSLQVMRERYFSGYDDRITDTTVMQYVNSRTVDRNQHLFEPRCTEPHGDSSEETSSTISPIKRFDNSNKRKKKKKKKSKKSSTHNAGNVPENMSTCPVKKTPDFPCTKTSAEAWNESIVQVNAKEQEISSYPSNEMGERYTQSRISADLKTVHDFNFEESTDAARGSSFSDCRFQSKCESGEKRTTLLKEVKNSAENVMELLKDSTLRDDKSASNVDECERNKTVKAIELYETFIDKKRTIQSLVDKLPQIFSEVRLDLDKCSQTFTHGNLKSYEKLKEAEICLENEQPEIEQPHKKVKLNETYSQPFRVRTNENPGKSNRSFEDYIKNPENSMSCISDKEYFERLPERIGEGVFTSNVSKTVSGTPQHVTYSTESRAEQPKMYCEEDIVESKKFDIGYRPVPSFTDNKDKACEPDQKDVSFQNSCGTDIKTDVLREKDASQKLVSSEKFKDLTSVEDEINDSVGGIRVQSGVTSFQQDISREMLENKLPEKYILKEMVNEKDQKYASQGNTRENRSKANLPKETQRAINIKETSGESPRESVGTVPKRRNETSKSVRDSADNRASKFVENKKDAENKIEESVTRPSTSHEPQESNEPYIKILEDVDDVHNADSGDVRSNSSTIMRMEQEAAEKLRIYREKYFSDDEDRETDAAVIEYINSRIVNRIQHLYEPTCTEAHGDTSDEQTSGIPSIKKPNKVKSKKKRKNSTKNHTHNAEYVQEDVSTCPVKKTPYSDFPSTVTSSGVRNESIVQVNVKEQKISSYPSSEMGERYIESNISSDLKSVHDFNFKETTDAARGGSFSDCRSESQCESNEEINTLLNEAESSAENVTERTKDITLKDRKGEISSNADDCDRNKTMKTIQLCEMTDEKDTVQSLGKCRDIRNEPKTSKSCISNTECFDRLPERIAEASNVSKTTEGSPQYIIHSTENTAELKRKFSGELMESDSVPVTSSEQPKIYCEEDKVECKKFDEGNRPLPSFTDDKNNACGTDQKDISLEIYRGIGIKTDAFREKDASKNLVCSDKNKDVSREIMPERIHQKDASDDALNRTSSHKDDLSDTNEDFVNRIDPTIEIPDKPEGKIAQADMHQDLKALEHSSLNDSLKLNIVDTTKDSIVEIQGTNTSVKMPEESLFKNDSMSETTENILNKRNTIETPAKTDQKDSSKKIPLDTELKKGDSRRISQKPNLGDELNESVGRILTVQDGSVMSSVTSFQKDISSEVPEIEISEKDLLKKMVNTMDQKDASEENNQGNRSKHLDSNETQRETVMKKISEESPIGTLDEKSKSESATGDKRTSKYVKNKRNAKSKVEDSITRPSTSQESNEPYIKILEDVDDVHNADSYDVRCNSSTIMRMEREAAERLKMYREKYFSDDEDRKTDAALMEYINSRIVNQIQHLYETTCTEAHGDSSEEQDSTIPSFKKPKKVKEKSKQKTSTKTPTHDVSNVPEDMSTCPVKETPDFPSSKTRSEAPNESIIQCNVKEGESSRHPSNETGEPYTQFRISTDLKPVHDFNFEEPSDASRGSSFSDCRFQSKCESDEERTTLLKEVKNSAENVIELPKDSTLKDGECELTSNVDDCDRNKTMNTIQVCEVKTDVKETIQSFSKCGDHRSEPRTSKVCTSNKECIERLPELIAECAIASNVSQTVAGTLQHITHAAESRTEQPEMYCEEDNVPCKKFDEENHPLPSFADDKVNACQPDQKDVSHERNCGIDMKADVMREKDASQKLVCSEKVKDVSKRTVHENMNQKDTSEIALNRTSSLEDDQSETIEDFDTQMDRTIEIPDEIEGKNAQSDMHQNMKAYEHTPLKDSLKHNIINTTKDSNCGILDRNSLEEVSKESLFQNDSMSETTEKVLNERRNTIETLRKTDQKNTSKTIPLDSEIEKENSRKISQKPNLEEDMNESVREIPSAEDGSVQSSVTSFQKDISSEVLELEMTKKDIVKEMVNIMDQADASEQNKEERRSKRLVPNEQRETVMKKISKESPIGSAVMLVEVVKEKSKSEPGTGDDRTSKYVKNKKNAESKVEDSITRPSTSHEPQESNEPYIKILEDVDDVHNADSYDVRCNSSTIMRMKREAAERLKMYREKYFSDDEDRKTDAALMEYINSRIVNRIQHLYETTCTEAHGDSSEEQDSTIPSFEKPKKVEKKSKRKTSTKNPAHDVGNVPEDMSTCPVKETPDFPRSKTSSEAPNESVIQRNVREEECSSYPSNEMGEHDNQSRISDDLKPVLDFIEPTDAARGSSLSDCRFQSKCESGEERTTLLKEVENSAENVIELSKDSTLKAGESELSSSVDDCDGNKIVKAIQLCEMKTDENETIQSFGECGDHRSEPRTSKVCISNKESFEKLPERIVEDGTITKVSGAPRHMEHSTESGTVLKCKMSGEQPGGNSISDTSISFSDHEILRASAVGIQRVGQEIAKCLIRPLTDLDEDYILGEIEKNKRSLRQRISEMKSQRE